MSALLQVEGVSKRFGGLKAVQSLSFAVEEGDHPRPDRSERRRQINACSI